MDERNNVDYSALQRQIQFISPEAARDKNYIVPNLLQQQADVQTSFVDGITMSAQHKRTKQIGGRSHSINVLLSKTNQTHELKKEAVISKID